MEKKIPWIGPSAGSRHWIEPPNKYLFNTYPLYLGDAQLLCKYAVETLGFKRIAIAYQNDDYGKQGLDRVNIRKRALCHERQIRRPDGEQGRQRVLYGRQIGSIRQRVSALEAQEGMALKSLHHFY